MNHKKILKSMGYEFGKSFSSKMWCNEIQWKDVFDIMDKVESLNKTDIIPVISESPSRCPKCNDTGLLPTTYYSLKCTCMDSH